MKSTSYLATAVLAVVALPSAPAHADPVQWTVASGGNGHFYEFRYDNNNFLNARASALASSYMGMSGYLATVTSAAEAAFLYGSVNTSIAYIGGSDEGHEGTWTWLDGPEAGGVFYSASGGPLDYAYSSWGPGEPNDGFPNGPENALITNNDHAGQWNDVRSAGQFSLGYYVEYSATADAGAVPEPASWAMMVAGFGMLGAGMRHRRRTAPRYA